MVVFTGRLHKFDESIKLIRLYSRLQVPSASEWMGEDMAFVHREEIRITMDHPVLEVLCGLQQSWHVPLPSL